MMLGLGAYHSGSDDEPDQHSSRPEDEEKEQHSRVAETTSKVSSKEALTNAPSATIPNRPFMGPSHEAVPQSTMSPDRDTSPFSTSRTVIQDLTLPPIPNLDIPPSPPGSPGPTTCTKFTHFLSLKTQNIHFNEKLASSASLKNPSLLRKMMEHSGVDDQAQYATSLPLSMWDTSTLPSWGFKEELLKAQKELHTTELKAAGQRGAIHFVPSIS